LGQVLKGEALGIFKTVAGVPRPATLLRSRPQDNFDIAAAKKILDEDHYGMSDVKDREECAPCAPASDGLFTTRPLPHSMLLVSNSLLSGMIKGSVHGKIVCLVGPPGVGEDVHWQVHSRVRSTASSSASPWAG